MARRLGTRCGSMTAGVLATRMAASTMSTPRTPSGCAFSTQQRLACPSRATCRHACSAEVAGKGYQCLFSAPRRLTGMSLLHNLLCPSLQGRALAFWKREVVDMMRDACEMWLGPEYGADGLRFDSANDFPKETVQARLQLTGSSTRMTGSLRAVVQDI